MLKGVNITGVKVRDGLLMVDGDFRFGCTTFTKTHGFSASVPYDVHEASQLPLASRIQLDVDSPDSSFFFTSKIPNDWHDVDIRRTATDILFTMIDQMLPELHAKWQAEQAA